MWDIRAKREPLLGKPSLQAWPSQTSPQNWGFSPWGMLSLDAHNPPKAEHIRGTIDRNAVYVGAYKSSIVSHSTDGSTILFGRRNAECPVKRATTRSFYTVERGRSHLHRVPALCRSMDSSLRRKNAEALTTAPHKRRRRLQQPTHLHPEQPSPQTIRSLPAHPHHLSRPHRSHPNGSAFSDRRTQIRYTDLNPNQRGTRCGKSPV